MKNINIFILTFPLVIMGFYLLFSLVGCENGAKDSMFGTCALPFLTPLYDNLSMVFLIASYSSLLWLPVVLFVYVLSMIRIIKLLKKRESKFLLNNWFILSVCTIWTIIIVMFLGLLFSI